MNQVDIAHLTFKPPFAPGSYNRLVGTQIEHLKEWNQVAISYWQRPLPKGAALTDSMVLVNDLNLALWQQAFLRLPESLRRLWFNGVSGREWLVYLWQILRVLPQMRPKLVICYDNYKVGQLLKQVIDWPCRLILSQHGHSYHLTPGLSAKLYSLGSYDTVCTLTYDSYRFDFSRVSAYEPTVAVLPNMVDTKVFAPASPEQKTEWRKHWQLPPDKLVMLILGRLVPKKGAHAILQSWPRILEEVPNALLWVVGGGDRSYEQYLKNMVHALKVGDSVVMQGAVPPNQIHSCYQASDIYLFPSLCSEGFPLSLLESMASGVPCIASKLDVLQELYPKETLILVPDPNIEDAFVRPILTLARDEQARSALGNASRAFVEQNYRVEKVLSTISEFYQRQINLVGG